MSASGGAVSQTPATPNPAADDLTLVINGTSFGGWQDIRVTRGIEVFPSSFDISGTLLYPNNAGALQIKPGQACVVKIGSDTVLTGWVDRVSISADAHTHAVKISGRSKCEDLLDCSVDLQGCQISNTTVAGLARQLAAPYGVTVETPNGDGAPIPQVNFYITQTPYELIQQAARYGQMLVYDAPDGNLVLAQAGTTQMASGFAVPGNVERFTVDYNLSARYSEYRCYINSNDFLGSGAIPGNDGNRVKIIPDTGQPPIRHRVLSLIAEATYNLKVLAIQQATWEMNRRRGRSQAVRVTCDSWRDSAGTLWTPNALALVDIPAAKISSVNWIIAQVTYRRGDDGTHADVVLMPPESFQPKPENLYLFDPAVSAALAKASGGAAAGATTTAPDGTPIAFQ